MNIVIARSMSRSWHYVNEPIPAQQAFIACVQQSLAVEQISFVLVVGNSCMVEWSHNVISEGLPRRSVYHKCIFPNPFISRKSRQA